jgi:hypothetical protein
MAPCYAQAGLEAHYLPCNCGALPSRAILVTNILKGVSIMTSHRILQLNAVSTAACALGMLAARGTLYSLFGLDAPILLDVLAIGLLAYAGALAFAARRRVDRQTLMAFTIADAIWVGASAIVLVAFWGQLALVARVLVIAVALVVEVFATLQFRAAGRAAGSPEIA